MKIKFSKNQWLEIGLKAGFVKESRYKFVETPTNAFVASTKAPKQIVATKIKVAAPIPNTQNQNPDESNFAVDISGVKRSLGVAKSKINKELHALGNYFEEIPLSEIISILKRYNVILLQEDGTLWSGFITTQGECGSSQANGSGPMRFELAGKTDHGYFISNNYLIMTVCTMPSGRLEIIVYIS